MTENTISNHDRVVSHHLHRNRKANTRTTHDPSRICQLRGEEQTTDDSLLTQLEGKLKHIPLSVHLFASGSVSPAQEGHVGEMQHRTTVILIHTRI